MAESIVLFDSIISSRWFLRTSIILFLTKIDVFRDKLPKAHHSIFSEVELLTTIPQVPLVRYFPEYTGGPDADEAANYILLRFVQANPARLCIYAQYVPTLLASTSS